MGLRVLGVRVPGYYPIVQNQMAKEVENEMETKLIQGLRRLQDILHTTNLLSSHDLTLFPTTVSRLRNEPMNGFRV